MEARLFSLLNYYLLLRNLNYISNLALLSYAYSPYEKEFGDI